MIHKKLKIFSLLCLVSLLSVAIAHSEAGPQVNSVEELKAQIEALKTDYDQRIKDLEAKLEQLQVQMVPVPEAEMAVPPQPSVQSIPGALNPAISVIGNFVGRSDDQSVFNEEGNRIDDKMNLREMELDMRVAVDPYADGVFIASFESEFPGEFETGVEEGYVIIKRLPFLAQNPLGMRLKIGRYRPLFGKYNILHTHDLPTTFRPLPIEEFLGEEGFVQNGISTNFYLPTPWDPNSSLDATIEVMDGGRIAISPDPAARFSYVGHLRWFRTFQDAHSFELGFSSYFQPSGNGISSANAHGVDFLYRWKPLRRGQWRSYLLGAELIFSPNSNPEIPEEIAEEFQESNVTPVGFTVFNQWQFDRRTYAGLRYDQTESLINPDIQRCSITPYLSYYFSEFLRFRVNYERRWSDLIEEDGRNSVFFELNWVFGSHPPEPFWVNK